MAFSRQVAIGPEFFQKSKNDYHNWRWALAREFYQNCIDAPRSKNIDITIAYDQAANETTVTVANDGEPMTEDILVNKLLALGSSGKAGADGAVGGFGKAKEVLYYLHKRYEIRTGNLMVTGSGAGYDLAQYPDDFHGTVSTIVLPGDETLDLHSQFARFAAMCQWDGKITITFNGKKVEHECRLHKGSRQRDLGDWGVVYTNKSFEELLIVRVQGMPMFTRHIDFKGCVLVELTGLSTDVLQSSRDGLRAGRRDELDQFVTSLSVNKRQALKDRNKTTKRKVEGKKLSATWFDEKALKTPQKGNPLANELSVLVSAGVLSKEVVVRIANDLATGNAETMDNASQWLEAARGEHKEQQTNNPDLVRLPDLTAAEVEALAEELGRVLPAPAVLGGMEFCVKDETGMKIPDYYLPEGMGSYAKGLMDRWVKCLIELGCVTKVSKPFSVGFIFSEDAEAHCDGDELYINPVRISGGEGKPRSMAKAFSFDAKGNWKILSCAVHEWAHFMTPGHGHDEEYANVLTEVFGLVLANAKRFGRVFNRGGD